MATDKNVDEGKGRLKEAAGSLTDDQDLKNEGKSDRAKASVKDKVDTPSPSIPQSARPLMVLAACRGAAQRVEVADVPWGCRSYLANSRAT